MYDLGAGFVVLGVNWLGPAALTCMAGVLLTVVAEPLLGQFWLKCVGKVCASTCFLWAALAAAAASASAGGGEGGVSWSMLAQGGGGGGGADKLMEEAMAALIAAASPYTRVVLGALVFGWVGDVCLLFQGQLAFMLGLASFLMGHLLFSWAFLFLGGGFDLAWHVAFWAVMVCQALVVYAYLRPHLSSFMKPPVVAYMIAICLMAAAAGGMYGGRDQDAKSFNILVGSFFFWISDLSVARNSFVSPGPENPALGLPLYYAAQLIIACNLFP